MRLGLNFNSNTPQKRSHTWPFWELLRSRALLLCMGKALMSWIRITDVSLLKDQSVMMWAIHVQVVQSNITVLVDVATPVVTVGYSKCCLILQVTGAAKQTFDFLIKKVRQHLSFFHHSASNHVLISCCTRNESADSEAQSHWKQLFTSLRSWRCGAFNLQLFIEQLAVAPRCFITLQYFTLVHCRMLKNDCILVL